MTSTFNLSQLRRWSAIPLRLIVGYGFIAHGYAKVVNGPDHFAASLQGLGVPAPHMMAWVTIGFELLGGLAVLLGAYIPFFSLPLTVILLVAVITVHLPYGFSSIKFRGVTAAGPQFGPPGYETDLLYIAAPLRTARSSSRQCLWRRPGSKSITVPLDGTSWDVSENGIAQDARLSGLLKSALAALARSTQAAPKR